jgi:hypothetical protein
MVKAIQGIYSDVLTLEQTVSGFAQSFTTNRLCVDKSDGTPVCITGDQLATLLNGGEPSVEVSGPSTTISGTSTAPTITINGNSPAIIDVGSTYSDLGATAPDNEGRSLGILDFLNGIAVPSITIGTSAPATDTIDYVATDTWGNTSTSTRSVIVEATASSAGQ